jgi:hypothetical protein
MSGIPLAPDHESHCVPKVLPVLRSANDSQYVFRAEPVLELKGRALAGRMIIDTGGIIFRYGLGCVDVLS